jgi:hypothetical protein
MPPAALFPRALILLTIEEPALTINLVASLRSSRDIGLAKFRGTLSLVNKLINHLCPDTVSLFNRNLSPLTEAVLAREVNHLIVPPLRYTDTLNLDSVSTPTLTSFPLEGNLPTVEGDGVVIIGPSPPVATGRTMKYMGNILDHARGIRNILAARRVIL